MATYGIGTNTMLNGSAMPWEHDKHVLKCYPIGDEQAVFKWSTHPTQETHNRMLSNTSMIHVTADAETARALTAILGGELQTDSKPQKDKLRDPLGPCNTLVHHRGYEGSFVELSEPGKAPRLIEVCSSQEAPGGNVSLIRGWESTPAGSSSNRTSPRLKSTGKLWGNPVVICITRTPSCHEHAHLAIVVNTGIKTQWD